MQISQEVRAFAAKQNQESDAFIAAVPLRTGEEDYPTDGGVAQAALLEEAEKGMAEMSEKFREEGGEIYLPAG